MKIAKLNCKLRTILQCVAEDLFAVGPPPSPGEGSHAHAVVRESLKTFDLKGLTLSLGKL